MQLFDPLKKNSRLQKLGEQIWRSFRETQEDGNEELCPKDLRCLAMRSKLTAFIMLSWPERLIPEDIDTGYFLTSREEEGAGLVLSCNGYVRLKSTTRKNFLT